LLGYRPTITLRAMLSCSFPTEQGRRMMRGAPGLALMLFALGSCGSNGDKAASERAVAQIHRQLDAGKLHEIYAGSSDELKHMTSEREFDQFLGTVRDRLGKTGQASQRGWKVNYGTSGGTVELNYRTQFEHGSATEDFLFRAGGEQPRLLGYHVASKALE
jgi:hypothetical protein